MKSFVDLKLVLILLIFIMLVCFLFPNFMGDDSFIHLGFAKGIVSCEGYSFAGNKTYGDTSPLWPIAIALINITGIDLELSSRILSGIFSVLSIMAMYYIGKKYFDNNVAIIISLMLVFNSYFLRWSISGMESTAAMFCMLCLYLIQIKINKSNSFSPGTGFLFGLSILIRPEFLGFVFIFYVYNYFCNKTIRKLLIKSSLICLFPVLIWLIYAFLQFGSIVPNTFHVKAGGNLLNFEFSNFIRTITLFISGNLVEIIGSVIFILLIWSRTRFQNIRIIDIKNIDFFVIILCIISFYLFYILKGVTIVSRYSLIFIPSIILIFITLFYKTFQDREFKSKRNILIIILFISFLFNSFFTLKYIKPDADRFVYGFQNTYRKIADIMKNYPVEGEKSVALSDVGIIGTYSNSKVLDLNGLVDHNRFKFNDKKSYLSYYKPNFIVLREEIEINKIIDSSRFDILFSAEIPSLGINDNITRNVTLYKIIWD